MPELAEQIRQVIDGILHRIRTGAHWRDLPERFGPWKTVYERHRSTPLPCAPISTPPAPVSRCPHRFQKGDAGSELTGEAARLSLCARLAEVVQAAKGSAAYAAGSPPRST